MIFEIRTYQLKPGTVPNAVQAFADKIENRVKLSPLAGFWHTEVGELNKIIHIWPYKDINERNEIRAKAEAHARMLRMKGEEAWVRHDEDKRTSIVTIGAFDSTAYDPRSTLFSPPVERIFRQHPVMLVNGEELLQPPQKGSPPGTPAMPQPAVLIEIPP